MLPKESDLFDELLTNRSPSERNMGPRGPSSCPGRERGEKINRKSTVDCY
jgi:hypothetical protein